MSDQTSQHLYAYARRVIESQLGDIDYQAVGEMFAEEWAALTEEEFDDRQGRVAFLAESAVVTVTWPKGGDS